MYSELHERLEYLVNFSSQLIFVSGDSISQQQRSLESFVFQQPDDTEIAFVAAETTFEMSDYRRLLCRQLLGQTVGSFVRPLNELLASLNEHEGPVLIAITQAHNVPDALIQELWGLVLQSRFAANKQHLNVLLFGEPGWAERTKQWLPTRNNDTPLLISSQSVIAEKAPSDLERLLEQKREAFNAHLASRHTSLVAPAEQPNRLASGWFWVAIVAIFAAIFMGMLAWQNQGGLPSLFTPISTPEDSEDAPVKPGSAFSELKQSTESVTDVVNPPQDKQITQSESPQPDTNERLVSNWREALPELKDRTGENKNESAISDNSLAGTTTEVVSGNEPVSADEAAVSPELPSEDVAATTQAVEPDFSEQIVINDAETKATTSEDTAILKLDNEALLSSVRPGDFYLQMSGLQDEALMHQFIEDNNLQKLVKVYRTYRYGGNWFVVLFHQPFTSLADARASMAALPDFQGKQNAFVKAGNQVLSELNTTGE